MPVEIYSTETDDGCISVVRKGRGLDYELAARIPVGTAPRGAVQFTPDGRGYVANSGDGTVSEIDLDGRRERARIQVGDHPRAVALVPSARFALVSHSGSGRVSVVDLDRYQEVGRLYVGEDPRHMAVSADGRWAYVAVWGSRYIAKVDLAPLAEGTGSAKVACIRQAERLPSGELGHPNSITLHRDGKRAYVAKTEAACVTALDLEAGTVAAEIPVGGRGGRVIAVSADGRYGFASIEHRSEVAVIDLDQACLVRRIPVGSCPRGVAVDPHDLTVYSCGFSRTARLSRMSCSPKALTVVHLGSARELNAEVELLYTEIPLGAGPSSVSVVDLDGMSTV